MLSGMHTLIDPLFRDFQLLSIFIFNKLQTCCFMYKISKCLLPTVFQNLFTLNSNVHDHKTRQSSKLHVISHRTNSRAYSIQIHGVRLWNIYLLAIKRLQYIKTIYKYTDKDSGFIRAKALH